MYELLLLLTAALFTPLDTDCAWCLHQERLSSVCKYFVVYKLHWIFLFHHLEQHASGGMMRKVVVVFDISLTMRVCRQCVSKISVYLVIPYRYAIMK